MISCLDISKEDSVGTGMYHCNLRTCGLDFRIFNPGYDLFLMQWKGCTLQLPFNKNTSLFTHYHQSLEISKGHQNHLQYKIHNFTKLFYHNSSNHQLIKHASKITTHYHIITLLHILSSLYARGQFKIHSCFALETRKISYKTFSNQTMKKGCFKFFLR